MTTVMPFRIPGDVAQVDNIQTGETTFTGLSDNVTVTAVVMAKSILFFTYESDDTTDDPEQNFVNGQLTTTTNIKFTKFDTGSSIIVRWFLVEFKSTAPVNVQRGASTLASNPDNITISSVNTANTFPIISWSNSGTIPSEDDACIAQITSNTNLKLERASGISTIEIQYQVIENTDWDVTEYTFSLDTSTSSTKETITAVDMTETFIFMTGKLPGANNINGEEVPIYDLFSTTQLEIFRDNPSFAWDMVAYVIETNGKVSVQHENNDVSGASDTPTISSVNTAKSIIKNNCVLSNVGSNIAGTDADGDKTYIKAKINSATQIGLDRGGSTDTVKVATPVLEFT